MAEKSGTFESFMIVLMRTIITNATKFSNYFINGKCDKIHFKRIKSDFEFLNKKIGNLKEIHSAKDHQSGSNLMNIRQI